MPRHRAQFTMRQMILGVLGAAWVCFNAMLLARIAFADWGPPGAPVVSTARIVVFITLGVVIGTLVAITLGIGIRRWLESFRLWPAVRGGCSGCGAGCGAWFIGTILLCVAYAADGQAPMGAVTRSVGLFVPSWLSRAQVAHCNKVAKPECGCRRCGRLRRKRFGRDHGPR
jgi:hypothetical protein